MKELDAVLIFRPVRRTRRVRAQATIADTDERLLELEARLAAAGAVAKDGVPRAANKLDIDITYFCV